MLGVISCLVSASLSVPLAHFFHEPRLVPVILVVGVSYVILSFRTVPVAALQHELAFRTLARNDLVWVTVTALTSIALAALGMGYWSLILSHVIGGSVATLLAWRAAPQGLARPRWSEIQETLRFGAHLLVSRLGGYANGNADSIVIGRWLGNGALGSYRVAMEIASLPLEKVAGVILQVMTPVFASIRMDREAMSRYLLLMTEALSLLGWPLAIGLALVADLAVPVVLGATWLPAVAPMRVLALAGAIRCITPLLSSIAQARGHSLLLARLAGLGVVVLVGGLLLGVRWGVVGVASAWAVSYPALMIPILLYVLKDLNVPVKTYVRTLLPAFGGCLGMALAVLETRRLLAESLQPGALLATLVATGALAYAGTLLLVAGIRVRRIWFALRTRATAIGS
jgi:PST family polysaccharide transporter